MSGASRKAIIFRIADDALYVANFGIRFDRRGVISICRENLSAKTERGLGKTLDDVPDHALANSIRERRLAVYRTDPDQLQEDANHEEETSSDYVGRSLWELLQNADDALAPSGTSSANLIGAKGLGFKSVLEISERPSVHSGPFDFGFDPELSCKQLEEIQLNPPRLTFRLPHNVPRDEQVRELLRQKYATVIRLPFRSPQARKSVITRLDSLEPHFLLLCRNLDTVIVERPDAPKVQLTVSRSRSAGLRNSPATLTVSQGNETDVSHWQIWSALAPAPTEQSKSLSAAIAICLIDGTPSPHTETIPVHVFFPTVESISARFLLHGSFALTSNRNSIRPDTHDERIRNAVKELVLQVVEDIPALSMVRLFSEMVRAAGGGRAKRPDRLIQQAISSAVTGSASIPLIGGGWAKPGEVRTWEHDLDHVVPPRIAKELKLPARDLIPVFGELRNTFEAQALRAGDYANILSRTRATTLDNALACIRIAYSACLAVNQQDAVVAALSRAAIWPTVDGRYRSLDQQPPLIRTRPSEWPSWLSADTLHPAAQDLLDGYDAHASARWSGLLNGRLLRTKDEWLRHALAPELEDWSDDGWHEKGYEALGLIDQWVSIPDFADSIPFVDRPEDTSVRPVLARITRIPARSEWVPARNAYAGRDLGGSPELAAFFKSVPDRAIVGTPRRAIGLFGQRRWKALLRYLGVSWEPKVLLIPRNGSLQGQPGYSSFRMALTAGGIHYVNQEWYIEHFPAAIECLSPSQVVTCVTTLAAATAGLAARWRKVDWADRSHAPEPFWSYADFQLRRERYLPQRPIAGVRGERLAPHELFWPGKGIAGITPILDVGTINKLRRAGLKATFVDRLDVHDTLPRDWATWRSWSDKLLALVDQGAAPSSKAVRDFYDALLHTPRPTDGASKLARVAAIRPGIHEEVVTEKSSETIWIDQGRFENQEVLTGLGQIGRSILPVRLDRGEGAPRMLGVKRASEVLTVEPTFKPCSDRKTKLLEMRVNGRRGALAAICGTKNLPLRATPKLVAVQDLRLKISFEGSELADRNASSFDDGGQFLINLQAADVWEAVASAVAEPFGAHATDLKYRFARVLRARRAEIASILADDGIPGYRIREALRDFDEDSEDGDERSDAETAVSSEVDPGNQGNLGDEPNDVIEVDDLDGADDEDSDENGDPGGQNRDQHNGHRSWNGGGGGDLSRPRRLSRRKLYNGGGDIDEDRGRRRRDASDAAKAAAGRGMRAEAWLLEQIVGNVDPSWRCSANVRDDYLRETDVLLARGGKEWHIEVKSLSTERIYWSELEREKAEKHRGQYIMALLVEVGDGTYRVRWAWDPLQDLVSLERRIEWLWEGSSEGPSLSHGWQLEPGLRWPERRADRFLHVVRVTEDDLEALDEDGSTLELLRKRIEDIKPTEVAQAAGRALAPRTHPSSP